MTRIKSLVLAMLLLPFLELAAFFALAARIGFGWTFVFLLTTSAAGFLILRYELSQSISLARAAVIQNHYTSISNFTSINGTRGLVLLGGFLLLVPGFISDLAGGLALFIAVSRSLSAMPRDRRGVIDLDPEQWRREPEPDLRHDRGKGGHPHNKMHKRTPHSES